MKRRYIFSGIAIVLFGAVLWLFLWGPSTKASNLELALGITELPPSVEIVGEAIDSWTDHISHHSITLDPDDFELLLAGRPFKKIESIQLGTMKHGGYMSNLPAIDVAEKYEVQELEENGVWCSVYVNESWTEAYVFYAVD
ncbi:hypothetical protein AAFN60_21245 [Roseibacillus persicicus]|uniref:hypothetical protein n=1 Tax=Roseibacillus persicicus TaxID=454148 RepID=UPI00398B0708